MRTQLNLNNKFSIQFKNADFYVKYVRFRFR